MPGRVLRAAALVALVLLAACQAPETRPAADGSRCKTYGAGHRLICH